MRSGLKSTRTETGVLDHISVSERSDLPLFTRLLQHTHIPHKYSSGKGKLCSNAHFVGILMSKVKGAMTF